MKTYPVRRKTRRARTLLITSAKQAKSASTRGNRVGWTLQVTKKILPDMSNWGKRDIG
jgi:hypothetical protein